MRFFKRRNYDDELLTIFHTNIKIAERLRNLELRFAEHEQFHATGIRVTKEEPPTDNADEFEAR